MPTMASVVSAAVIKGGTATPAQVQSLTPVAESTPQGASILSYDVGPTPHTVTHSPVNGTGPTQTTISPATSPTKSLGGVAQSGTILGTVDQVQ